MKGKRVADYTEVLNPGEYSFFPEKQEGRPWWGTPWLNICTPNGMFGSIVKHSITVNEDGTISVSPSILCKRADESKQWHGYLEKGIWREV